MLFDTFGFMFFGLLKIIDFSLYVCFSAGLDFSTFKSRKRALLLKLRLQNELMEFQAMVLKAYKN